MCVYVKFGFVWLFSITFGISIGLTAVVLLVERNEGLLDRSWVAGVNVTELLISQVITQFIIIIVQVVLMISITIWAFKVIYIMSELRSLL